MSKAIFLAVLIWPFYAEPSVVHEVIWRCGQVFTDDPDAVSRAKCQVLANSRMSTVSRSRVIGNEQRVRDVNARAILETELRQAEQHLIQLLRSSANKASKQAEIMRIRGDIAGLQREIERLR